MNRPNPITATETDLRAYIDWLEIEKARLEGQVQALRQEVGL